LKGTVIAISHDRYFLRQIATRVLSFDEVGGVLTP
jgi:ATPase subunit of ABC transporter with duplicated ATPase domains